jgi:hypothetical protein
MTVFPDDIDKLSADRQSGTNCPEIEGCEVGRGVPRAGEDESPGN